MPNYLKLLTEDYINQHLTDNLSAAKIMYNLLAYPEKFDLSIEAEEKASSHSILPDTSPTLEMVRNEENTDRLLRMFRQASKISVRDALIDKLLTREDEVLPEIERMMLKAFKDETIEHSLFFILKCKTNCSDWIVENLKNVRDPYAQSTLCLALGFLADPDVIPFLMEQVNRFETEYPKESFDQGPLFALIRIQERFAGK